MWWLWRLLPEIGEVGRQTSYRSGGKLKSALQDKQSWKFRQLWLGGENACHNQQYTQHVANQQGVQLSTERNRYWSELFSFLGLSLGTFNLINKSIAIIIIKGYVAVNFCFPFVLNSLAYITIHKNNGKIKINWNKILTTTDILVGGG